MPGLKRNCTKATNEECIEKIDEYVERTESGQIKCKIIDCKTTLARYSTFYLKRHLRAKPFSIFKHLFEDEMENEILQKINALKKINRTKRTIQI